MRKETDDGDGIDDELRTNLDKADLRVGSPVMDSPTSSSVSTSEGATDVLFSHSDGGFQPSASARCLNGRLGIPEKPQFDLVAGVAEVAEVPGAEKTLCSVRHVH